MKWALEPTKRPSGHHCRLSAELIFSSSEQSASLKVFALYERTTTVFTKFCAADTWARPEPIVTVSAFERSPGLTTSPASRR
jgi:hypothetical protein